MVYTEKIPEGSYRNAESVYNSTLMVEPSEAFLAGKKMKFSNIFYVKETVQVVPEKTYKTHRVNPCSVTLVSSIGTMVMFLSLD